MNKGVLLGLILALGLILPSFSYSQTNDEKNLKKYWENRDRLRKYFLKIGSGVGESLPAAQRQPYRAFGSDVGMLKWADGTSLHGWYIAVLATEYKLLSDAEQDVSGTLNELYFAIEAVNRLDGGAERYIEENLARPDEFNGWFLRDDINQNFITNWQYPGSTVTFVDGDAYDCEYKSPSDPPSSFHNPGNEPSWDQAALLFMGLTFVKKFVPEQFVQPTAERGFFILDEIKTITERIMDRLIILKDYKGSIIHRKRNWCFGNPITGYKTLNGSDDYLYHQAYPFAIAAEFITGNNYLDEDLWYETMSGIVDTEPMEKDILKPNSLQHRWEEIMDGSGIITGNQTTDNQQKLFCLAVLAQSIPRNWNNTPWKLNVSWWSDHIDLPIYPLMWDVLYDATPDVTDRGRYLDYLNDMPECEGCYNFDTDDPNMTLNGRGERNWAKAMRWQHPEQANASNGEYGNFSSLDYMLLYNLFHIKYNQELNLPVYTPEVICPCNSTKFPEINNAFNNLNLNGRTEIILSEITNGVINTTKEVQQYQFDYTEYNINLERYLIQNLNIQSSGTLKLFEDIKACNNSETIISTGGKIQVGDGITKNSIFRLSKGTVLDITGTLEIKNNSKVIIESGATLIINPGTIIELNGTNAVLEIRGKLDIKAGVTFHTFGNGHVLFNIKTIPAGLGPHNIAATSTSSMEFVDSSGTQPFKLKVAPGTILFPPSNLSIFKMQGVTADISGEGASIKLVCNFHIVGNHIWAPDGDGISIYHIGHTQYITDNIFDQGIHALNILAANSLYDVKIQYNSFLYCKNAITLLEHPAHVAGNLFSHCDQAINAGASDAIMPPRRAGNYRGPLRIELNRFENSAATIIAGNTNYPSVNFTGNVVINDTRPTTPTTSFGFYAGTADANLKCNTFKNVQTAIQIADGTHLNMSTGVPSRFLTVTNGEISGGNNYFTNNYNSLVMDDIHIGSPTFISYNMQSGENSFYSQPNTGFPGSSTVGGYSLVISRTGYQDVTNYLLDAGTLHYRINGNAFSPLFPHQLSSPPSDIIERNAQHHSYHFNILERDTPDMIVGTLYTPTNTCPIGYWDDAISDPVSFDPMMASSFGMQKRGINRPFGTNEQNFGTTNTTIGAGSFSGQTMGIAYETAAGGLTDPTTSDEGTVEIPNATGLLDMANLLTNTYQYRGSVDAQLFNYGYRIYFNTLEEAYVQNVFAGNTSTENAHISAAETVLSTIHTHNSQYELTEPERFYNTRFITDIDKCNLYRTFDRYTDALSTLSAIQAYVDTADQNTVDYMTCMITNEKNMYDSTINWIEFEKNISTCAASYPGTIRVLPDSVRYWTGDSIPPEEPMLTFTLSPNPATTMVTVDMDLNVDGTVVISMLDGGGVPVISPINMGSLTAGTYNQTIPLFGLSAGVYTVIVYVNDVPFDQLLLKLE